MFVSYHYFELKKFIQSKICIFSIFLIVDGPEWFSILAQLDTEGNILTKFQKHPTSGLEQEMFTDGQLDGRRRVPRP